MIGRVQNEGYLNRICSVWTLVDHLLASCVVARQVWHRLLHSIGLQSLVPQPTSILCDWWQRARKLAPKAVLLITWNLWKERNRRTFDGVSRTSAQLCNIILEEVNAWVGAGFSSLSSLLAIQRWGAHCSRRTIRSLVSTVA